MAWANIDCLELVTENRWKSSKLRIRWGKATYTEFD